MSDTEDDISEADMLRLRSATAPDPQTRLNVDSNRVFLTGSQQYVDFEASIDRLKAAEVTTPDLLAQALELDNPAMVLHQLGQEENIDLAKKIAKMTPVKRAQALATLERGESISDKAATPMWKRSRADLGNESLSDKEWNAVFKRRYPNGWHR